MEIIDEKEYRRDVEARPAAPPADHTTTVRSGGERWSGGSSDDNDQKPRSSARVGARGDSGRKQGKRREKGAKAGKKSGGTTRKPKGGRREKK
jgi:hypothetical protein